MAGGSELVMTNLKKPSQQHKSQGVISNWPSTQSSKKSAEPSFLDVARAHPKPLIGFSIAFLLAVALWLLGNLIAYHELANATPSVNPDPTNAGEQDNVITRVKPSFEWFSWLGVTRILSFFAAEVAVAFLIAFILILFVETPAREANDVDFREKQRIISKNIFDYIYGVRMPKSLFNFVEHHFLKAKLYRRNMMVTYTFEEKVGSFWKVRIVSSYTLRNLTRSAIEHTIKGSVEKPHCPPETTQQVQCGLDALYIDDLKITDEQIQNAKNTGDQDTEDSFRFGLKRTIPSEGKIKVSMTMICLQHERDSELCRTLEPARNIKCVINHPKDMNINAAAIHPKRAFDVKIENPGNLILELDAPLMPQNGILLWWETAQGIDC